MTAETLIEHISEGTRFTVDGYRGIAFYVKRYPIVDSIEEWDDDFECEILVESEDFDRAVMVMVGDDREHIVEITDLTALTDDEYCSCCGQMGCGWS